MTKFKYLYVVLASILLLGSCKDEPVIIKDPLVISFKEKSINFNSITDKYDILFSFSEKPENNGSIVVKLSEENITYGVDYKTIPEATNGIVEIPFSGENYQNTKLSYVTLIPPTSSKRKLALQITKINHDNSIIQGYTDFEFSYEDSKGGVMQPNIGGPNQPNQVFIDLSGKSEHLVQRDSWSLGFYSGETFNVVLNETNSSAAGAIESNNIDSVREDDFTELKKVVKGSVGNTKYIDDPNRDFSKNAIAEISANSNENKVYLLNLGKSVPTKQPKVGSTNTIGESLGYKKVRFLRKDNGYLMQYANLDATEHKEVFIPKSTEKYAFTYFDFKTEKIVKVAPRMDDWDISFTVFTNVTRFGNQDYSYSYSDYLVSNKLGGVKIYSILNLPKDKLKEYPNITRSYPNIIEEGYLECNTELTYKKFSKENLAKYSSKLKSSRIIPGSLWRNVFKKDKVLPMYFIIEDSDGNIYKLQILEMTNEKGERGYSKIEYELVD